MIYYDKLLVPDHLVPLGEKIRSELSDCVETILRVTKQSMLLEFDPVVRRNVEVRLPFVEVWCHKNIPNSIDRPGT